MSPKTAAILEEIRDAVAEGQASIVPAFFQPRRGLGGVSANVSSAFRAAKKEGIIEVDYKATDGSTVYRPVQAVAVDVSSPWYRPTA